MKFFLLLLLLQAENVPSEDSVDYAAALQRWSMCAHLAIMGASPKLMSQGQTKALLTQKCTSEEQDFEAKITAFIMIDGDPDGTAAPVAREETARVRRNLVQDMDAKLQRRVLMRNKAEANKWMACLEATKSPCAAEEATFTAAARKSLKADGVPDGAAGLIITQFVKRTRQRIANGVGR